MIAPARLRARIARWPASVAEVRLVHRTADGDTAVHTMAPGDPALVADELLDAAQLYTDDCAARCEMAAQAIADGRVIATIAWKQDPEEDTPETSELPSDALTGKSDLSGSSHSIIIQLQRHNEVLTRTMLGGYHNLLKSYRDALSDKDKRITELEARERADRRRRQSKDDEEAGQRAEMLGAAAEMLGPLLPAVAKGFGEGIASAAAAAPAAPTDERH